MNSAHIEQQRQQWLVQMLHDRVAMPEAPHWLAPSPLRRIQRGLQAYTDHADAAARRALAVSFPTVLALLGADTFGLLARYFWRTAPPEQGDLAMWGEALADGIASHPDLAEWPYLADCARLDWALAQLERAQDVGCDLASVHLLGQCDPGAVRLELQPGCMALSSAYPIATIWQSHQSVSPAEPAAQRFAPARVALAHGRGEYALVWRRGWRGQVQTIDAASARFVHAIQATPRETSLAQALELAGPEFAFDAWLVQALQEQRLWRVVPISEPPGSPT
jgi:hypothetical protein